MAVSIRMWMEMGRSAGLRSSQTRTSATKSETSINSRRPSTAGSKVESRYCQNSPMEYPSLEKVVLFTLVVAANLIQLYDVLKT